MQLEANILEDGCLNPIITWRGIIIDGHNRYNICKKYNMPYNVLEKEFDSRDDVIAWICKNQLGRRNISEEIDTESMLVYKIIDYLDLNLNNEVNKEAE